MAQRLGTRLRGLRKGCLRGRVGRRRRYVDLSRRGRGRRDGHSVSRISRCGWMWVEEVAREEMFGFGKGVQMGSGMHGFEWARLVFGGCVRASGCVCSMHA